MPFAGYTDFDECVRKNSDKKDPKAYCGTIKHAVESWEAGMKVKTKDTKLTEFRATEIIDFDGSLIEAKESEDGRLTAKIRIIKAGVSANNRNYRVGALKKAAQEGTFNGVRMFVNHANPKDPQGHLKRGFMEMVSAIESTEYDEPNQALNGNIEFFDEAFYQRVNRAKNYAGVSISSLLRGTRTPQPGGRAYEDIHEFAQPRSVDWVVYPAAGGMILAMEDEEGELVSEIDWAAVEAEAGTLSEDEIKKNLPSLWAKWHPTSDANKLPIHGHESDEGDDEGDDDSKKDKKGVKRLYAQEEIDQLIDGRFAAYEKERKETEEKIAAANEQIRAAFAASGLPEKTRNRVMAGFEGVEVFEKDKVEKAITDAKEELKSLGLGPKITGMGPGGTPTSGDEKKVTFSAHESVAAAFGKKAEPDKSDDPDNKKKETGK